MLKNVKGVRFNAERVAITAFYVFQLVINRVKLLSPVNGIR